MGKSCNILHIVRLRQMLRRWRTRARGSAAATASGSPSTPADVPEGHLAVCVGSSNRRFVVRAAHLNHPAFRKLLIEAEEVHGFSQSGPLSLPCEESHFLQTLHQISSSYASLFPDASDLDKSGCYSILACDKRSWQADTLPLLSAEKPVRSVAGCSHSSPITCRSERRTVA